MCHRLRANSSPSVQLDKYHRPTGRLAGWLAGRPAGKQQ